ncbi:MAG: 2-C-methyl-D-erythritol 4-phosphate cytidylyltransferase [Candidatus Zipacnadales bacterium]
MPEVVAVLAAGGAGVRFREAAALHPDLASAIKTFLPLAGRPLWSYAASSLASVELVRRLLVVVPPDHVEEVTANCRELNIRIPAAVLAGGSRRQDSVYNALLHCQDEPPDYVVVHDGARPLASPDLIWRCVDSALQRGSGVAALPVTDTLKRASNEGRVESTVDRSSLWAIQTPQVFPYTLLRVAHETALRDGVTVTDDAALVERIGGTVWLVRGEETNLKVTTPADLRLAEFLLAERSEAKTMRVGHGFDAHRLERGRPCILGGVEIAHYAGPRGHSDGDVLTHAIMDAVLGALALGDIGQHFPDTDPNYQGVRSVELATRVTAMVHERGYRVTNIDATVIAEAPTIAPYVPAMRQEIACAFACNPNAVSIKGTTTEGMGFTGSGEGIAAHAVTVLQLAPVTI